MVDREEHLKISDLLYAKAKELNMELPNLRFKFRKGCTTRRISKEEIYTIRNKLLYLRKANITILNAKAKPEINRLLERSDDARYFIKNKLFG